MIYLASPYSHPDPEIRTYRFHAACSAAARLMRRGHVVFSPIAHGHPLAQHGVPTDWAYWKRQLSVYLGRCDELVVLTIDGWRESIGVSAEILIAQTLSLPVRYLAPAGDEPTRTVAGTTP